MFKRIRDFPRRVRLAFKIAFSVKDPAWLETVIEDDKVYDNVRSLAHGVLDSEEIFGQGSHDVCTGFLSLDEDAQRQQFIEHGDEILAEAKESFKTKEV